MVAAEHFARWWDYRLAPVMTDFSVLLDVPGTRTPNRSLSTSNSAASSLGGRAVVYYLQKQCQAVVVQG